MLLNSISRPFRRPICCFVDAKSLDGTYNNAICWASWLPFAEEHDKGLVKMIGERLNHVKILTNTDRVVWENGCALCGSLNLTSGLIKICCYFFPVSFAGESDSSKYTDTRFWQVKSHLRALVTRNKCTLFCHWQWNNEHMADNGRFTSTNPNSTTCWSLSRHIEAWGFVHMFNGFNHLLHSSLICRIGWHSLESYVSVKMSWTHPCDHSWLYLFRHSGMKLLVYLRG